MRRETIQAVADAGRVMLELPQDVVEQLGLPTVSTVARARADGSRNILPVAGPLMLWVRLLWTVRICQRRTTADCIVVAEGAEAVVGRVVTMDPGSTSTVVVPEGADPVTVIRRWVRGRSRPIVRCLRV